MSVGVVRGLVDKRFGLIIKDHQARRIREKALTAIQGYIEELKRTHPGSTVFAKYETATDGIEGTFQRLYVCLKPLLDGFHIGCKKLIGLDGCHTKVVEKESKETWTWFLETLRDDLKITYGNQDHYLFMNDKQKGLESSLYELLPMVAHRNRVQHIYRNFKKHHGSQLRRDKLWDCARASTINKYEAAMLDLKETDSTAHTWLEHNGGNPKNWCKAFFPLTIQSDMLCNNLSESFNASILTARDKPIITMLERIRKLCMERIKNNRLAISTKSGPICPNIMKIIEKYIINSDGFTYAWNGGTGYEVYCYGDQLTLDLKKKECSCRLWQLTGIPCVHSVPAIYSTKYLPVDVVNNFYGVQNFGWLYKNVLNPINGPSEWKATNGVTLLPLKFVRPAGRPKLSRKKDITEVKTGKGKEKLSRWSTQSCNYCSGKGHNIRTCPVKKADYEGNNGASGSHPKRYTKKKTTVRTEVDSEAVLVQEEYLHYLWNEMNDPVQVPNKEATLSSQATTSTGERRIHVGNLGRKPKLQLR